MPATEIAAPIARPVQDAATEGWIAASGESAKTGSRNLVIVSSTPGHLDQAGEQRQEGQHPHRDPHRRRPLGDMVVGAGEADVGVLHLAGRRVAGSSWATWPVSISSCASLHGRPGRTRKISRKV